MVAEGWLLAVVPSGLLAVGPSAELEVALEGVPPDPQGLIRALTDEDVDALCRVSSLSREAAAELLTALREAGALSEAAHVERAGHSLRAAIVGGPAADGTHEIVWTAEEALLLPYPLETETRVRALRAFVAGCEPFGRLRAYALSFAGAGDVAGDEPSPERLAMRLRECPPRPETISVLELAAGGSQLHVTVEAFAQLDASEAHRLGPIARIHPSENFAAEGLPELHFTVAEISEANLSQPSPAINRRVQGSGSLEHSQLAARAEGAERFAFATGSAAEVRTAAFDALEGAVDPASIIAFSARQLRGRTRNPSHHGARSWGPARTLSGELRWVPIEAELPLTSSGLAAHTDPALARTAALSELIERDAFMWTWLQRVSRERVNPASVPADVSEWSAALAAHGWIAHWINLTMEFQPTILCCLVHPERGIVVGSASRSRATDAARKATLEALVLALRFDPATHPAVPLEHVHSPADHLVLHMNPEHAPESDFLHASEDVVDLAELESEIPLDDALPAAGIEPILIDLTIPASRPFHVVRATAPGLVPLSFGWDNEPLGMSILARPRRLQDGREIGAKLDLSEAPPRFPHPFA
jgi:ribosomal protein S12 methylthiotransferase accessory factor